MNDHVNAQALAYVEGRLSQTDRQRVETHLAVCALCRAEVDDLRHLADVLAAVPRAFDAGLPARRARLWPGVWARVARAPAAAPARLQGRAAWALALAMCVLVVTGLLASPFQRGVLAAPSEPALTVIQTPAVPHSSLTSAPVGDAAPATADTTATLVLHTGQTPAPVPNP